MRFSKNLLASTALFALSQIMLSSCGSSSRADLSNVELIPVTTTKDGKWSMINDKGEIVFDSEFKNQPTASYNGLFTVEEGKGLTVYKIGGDKPEAVSGLENLKDAGFLEDGLMPVTFPDKRISIVDADGKIKFELTPIKGAEIISCSPGYKEGLLLIKTQEDKYGYVDKSGKPVIAPDYDVASDFSEGLAIVGKRDDKESDEYSLSVIDKSGKTQFKIKEGYRPISEQFNYGYILAKKEDRVYLINSKGEETKLNSKISYVRDYNDKYIIYANEDGEVGVANFNDEIIIRAKYDKIIFGNGDFFLAKKDSDDKDYVKLDTKGEESNEKIDYEKVYPFKQFGYFAKEGKTYVLLNEDFKKKGKEEFFDVNPSWSRGSVYTDYFNTGEVASTMVKMIEGNKVGNLKLGAPASQIFRGKSPKDYTYKSFEEFDNLKKEGFRYEISVAANFSANIADYDYDYYSYDRHYYWNPASNISQIILLMKAESEWGKKGQESLKNALSSAGYKLLKEGKYSQNYAAAFKKGNIIVLALSSFDGETANVLLIDGQYEANVLSNIMPLDSSENSDANNDFDSYSADSVAVVEETVVETADSVAADW